MTIKEVLKKLNSNFSDYVGSILSIDSVIDDIKEENDIEGDFTYDVCICEACGYGDDYETVMVYTSDNIPQDIANKDNTYFLSVEEFEPGVLSFCVMLNAKSAEDRYWDRYAWEENSYDKYADD